MSHGDDGDHEIDPVEFLRRALTISPEDAASVREDAAKLAGAMEREDRKRSAEADDDGADHVGHSDGGRQ